MDSRFYRNMGYRQPPYRLTAYRAAQAKKAAKAGASAAASAIVGAPNEEEGGLLDV